MYRSLMLNKKKLVKSVFLLLKGLLICAFIWHFVVLTFLNLPDNPISHQYKYQIMGYVDPLFSQTWHLFSPNPANTNNRVLIKFYQYKSGAVDSTEWYDIIEPLLDQKQASFWSPVQRILKNFSTSTIDLGKVHGKALEHINKTDSLKENKSAAGDFYKSAIASSSGHQAIMHYANYVLERKYADVHSKDSVLISYQVIFGEFPRFSKRELDYFDTKNYKYSVIQPPIMRIR